MILGLHSIRDIVKHNFNYWNRLRYTVNSDDFLLAYKLSNSEEKADIQLAIGKEPHSHFKDFIHSKKTAGFNSLQALSVRKLRIIAKNLNIPRYWILNKLTLVDEIKTTVEKIKADTYAKNTKHKEA